MKWLIVDAVFTIGVSLVVYGAACVLPAAGWIVGGTCLAVLAIVSRIRG